MFFKLNNSEQTVISWTKNSFISIQPSKPSPPDEEQRQKEKKAIQMENIEKKMFVNTEKLNTRTSTLVDFPQSSNT